MFACHVGCQGNNITYSYPDSSPPPNSLGTKPTNRLAVTCQVREKPVEMEVDLEMDLDLDCLFEFDSPIDTVEIDAAASQRTSPNEKASVSTSTGEYKSCAALSDCSPGHLHHPESVPTSQLPRLSCRGRENSLTAAGRASR